MNKRLWKHPPHNSLQEAMEACISFALHKHRRTIDHIAADMGLANKWVLYKWIENSRIPAVLIRPFEAACRCDFITRWLAHSSHQLLIPIPTGRLPKDSDIATLQASLSITATNLIAFAAGREQADTVIAAITSAMEHLALHRENVARAGQPELELEPSE